MYLYIYDSCLKDKKYKSLINKIENRIIDLDIKGKTLHLNLLKNINNFIKTEIDQGAHTVVIIGDDKTFSHALNSIISKDIVVGYIPIQNKSLFGQMFGIPSGELACNVLSGRIIKEIDVGEINKKYFLHSLKIEKADNVIVKIDNFEVKAEAGNQIIIKNFNSDEVSTDHKTNPTDGILDLFIEKQGNIFQKNSKHTLFTSKEINILAKTESVPIILDDYQIINTPAKINIAKEKLKIIVSSNRQF
jgi:hypothetical protein